MPRTRRRWASVGLPAIAAGPTFLLGLALAAWLRRPANVVPFGVPSFSLDHLSTGVALAMLVLVAATFVGTIVALPVVVIGSELLTWLGETNVGMRLPAFWALAGGLLAGAPVALIAGGRTDWVVPFAFTGTVVASGCRRWAEWTPQSRARKGLAPRQGKR